MGVLTGVGCTPRVGVEILVLMFVAVRMYITWTLTPVCAFPPGGGGGGVGVVTLSVMVPYE